MKTKLQQIPSALNRVKSPNLDESPNLIKEITPIIQEHKTIVITDTPSLTQATELLSKLNKYSDALEADKQAITAPINASLKAIRAKYKPTEDILTAKIAEIRSAMGKYHTEQIRLQQIAEKKLSDRVISGNLKIETATKKMELIEKPEQKIVTESGGITFRTQKKFEITDATKIPREYLVPDETAIREAMKANIELPGCRYWEEQVVFNKR